MVRIIEIFLKYLTRTKPLTLIFHLAWVLCICLILSINYVMAFYFTSLVHIYENAHHAGNFNTSLKNSIKVDAKINVKLSKLLTDTKSNRAYLFRYHNGLAAVSGVPFFFQTNTHEVISSGTPRLLQFYQRIPSGLTPTMSEKFIQNECMVVNNMDTPVAAQHVYFYLSRQNKAMIRCPIFMDNGDLFGYIGIDYSNDQTLDTLKDANAMVITTAIEIANILTP